MAIDLNTEEVLPFALAARRVPGRNGKGVAVSTLFRWASRGVRGIRLEFLQTGGVMSTSTEALQRFFDALTEQTVSANGTPREPTPRERSAASEKAKRELAQAGI
ncbi:MAG: DUF1580 domain-containing protein [Planctomycetota bacterium]